MTTPAWLQAAGLVLWGLAAGQEVIGVLLALARLLATARSVRLKLTDRDLNRAVDLSMLAVAMTVAGFVAAQSLPKGLLTATGWLPVTLFLLLLIDALSETRLRLRHLAVTMRRSTHPDADLAANLGAPYLAMTLLSAGVLAKPSPWFFWALAGLVLAWLFAARPRRRDRPLAAFALAALVAAGGGYSVSIGLQRAQLALEDWAVDAMSAADTDPYQSQTRIGDLGRVKLSDRIVWRVRQAPPARVPLLLRSGVFTRFASGTWLARRDAFAPMSPSSAEILHHFTLHGESSRGVAILPLPIDAGKISGESGIVQRNPYGVVRINDAPPLLDLSVATTPAAAQQSAEADDLVLPAGFSEVLQRLPELAALAQKSEQDRLAGIDAWFAAHFRYTLFLGDKQSGARDLERFLLTDRAGHCEYFATSTVLLLRALGIPARYVTGYSLQEYSPLEKAFLIRPRHAHAWTEAFVAGKWVEIDTTPSTWLTIEEDAAPFWRPLSDLMSFAWWRFAELRRDMATTKQPAGTWGLAALLAVLLAWLAVKSTRRPPSAQQRIGSIGGSNEAHSAVVVSFRALEAELAALGLGRRLTETPRGWIARVSREGMPVLGEARIAAACSLIETLYRNRYGSSAASRPLAEESS